MTTIMMLLVTARTAIGAFDYRETSPASLFPLNTAVVDYSIPATVANPAYLPEIGSMYIDASGGNPYTLEEIASSSMKIGGTLKGLGLQASWSRFGIKEYLENILEINFGYKPVKYIAFGSGVSYYNLSIKTDIVTFSANLFDIKGGVLIVPCKWVRISYIQDNIVSCFIKKRRDMLYPGWSIGGSIHPIDGLSVMWNINNTPNGYVNMISISLNVLKYLSIRAGYARELSSYSGSCTVAYKFISVSYGLRYHPYLGYTHSAGLTLALGELAFAPIKYGKKSTPGKNKNPQIRVDINSCREEELLNIPGIDKIYAERIMKYRSMFGPVSFTALYQIGLSKKEIDEIIPYIYGLTDSGKNNNDRIDIRNDGVHNAGKKKIIFQKLLDKGIDAYSALQIATFSSNNDAKKLKDFLDLFCKDNPGMMKEIQKICVE